MTIRETPHFSTREFGWDLAGGAVSINISCMSLPRFFCDLELVATARLCLPEAVSHHIRVRRLKTRQHVVLFNGTGIEATAELAFDHSGQAIAVIDQVQAVDRELPFRLTLVQGIASQDRMDWVVEKAVELGIDSLVPVTASRSVVKLNAERATKRTAQWHKQAIAASEQCGRNRLMQIHTPCSIEQAIGRIQAAPMLLCHLNKNTVALNHPPLLEAIRAAKAASVIVGPEGGWDESETNQWLAAGAWPITLGARVLRTETAGLAAVAGLSGLLG